MMRFLDLVTIVPCAGIVLRVIALGPTHPYLIVMYGLFALAVVARFISSPINFYCFTAPLPVLYMIYIEAAIHPDYSWSAVGFVPFLGIAAVAVIGRDLRALLAYTLYSMVWLAVAGHFYGSAGWTGALMFGAAGTGALAWVWLKDNPVAELKRVTGKLDELRGDASKITQQLQQENQKHDP